MADISFLITVFNCVRYLGAAVTSALAQQQAAIEVVVVDDGSDDGSESLLREIRDPRLRVVTAGRVGRPRALNLGAAACSAPCIAILDADDLALPDRAALSLEFMAEAPGCALVGSRFRPYIDAAGATTGREGVLPTAFADILAALDTPKNPLFHSSVTIRKAALLAVGGYDETLACALDLDLYIKLAHRYELHNLDARLSLKRAHPEQYFTGSNGVAATAAGIASRQRVAERAAALMAAVHRDGDAG